MAARCRTNPARIAARLRAGPTGRLTDTLLSTSEAIEMDARQKR